MGAGLASIPFAGKLFKEGAPEMKAAAKGIARTLSKVEGMPEWFNPLVNKIWKNGKNISPEVKRLEDTVHVRTLKDGDTVFTLTEHPLEGEIRVEIKSPRNPHGEPVELQYKKPKKDFDPDTGKTINEPGEFQVVESEPRWTNRDDPVLELGERVTSVDKAAGDIEAAERAVTGKIKNREKIKERRRIKDQMENNPTDYIDQEYGPEPGFYQQFKSYGDFARGGIAGYSSGGRVKYESGGIGLPPVEASSMNPAGFSYDINTMGRSLKPTINYNDDFNNFGGSLSTTISPFKDEPGTYSGNIYYGPEEKRFTLGFNNIPKFGEKQITGGYQSPYGNFNIGLSRNPYGNQYTANYGINFANGGHVNTHLTTTIPPVRGPNPQGVETLFKRRYS